MTDRPASEQLCGPPNRAYGIDFSGSTDHAGDNIWIAEAEIVEGQANVVSLYPGRDLPGSGSSRAECYPAILILIASNPDAAFGFDFPFGLPATISKHDDWEAFVAGFTDRFDGPDDLMETCDAIGAELEGDGVRYKRRTDHEASAPFSPYAMRIRYQTYHGIADLLAPLIDADTARILPMQSPAPGKAWVLEVCPSSTIQAEDLPQTGYKGSSSDHEETRREILAGLEEAGIKFDEDIREHAIKNTGGDALDALAGVLATTRTVRDDPGIDVDIGAEGYIYV